MGRFESVEKHPLMGTGPGTYLKQYNLPFPTANRSFLSCAIVLSTTPSSSTRPSSPTSRPLRSFLVFTLPVFDPSNSMEHEDKGHVRGRYTAVEEVREVETEEGRVIEWRCASMSTPGGRCAPSSSFTCST